MLLCVVDFAQDRFLSQAHLFTLWATLAMASRRGRSAKAESAEPEEIDVDDPGFGLQKLQFIDIKEELFEELGSDTCLHLRYLPTPATPAYICDTRLHLPTSALKHFIPVKIDFFF